MRKYESTHPWFKFTLNMVRADYRLWMALGEAVSKCEHLAGVPLQPDTAKNLHLLYLAKGIRATTAIEGNTLSEEEVLQRIEGKLELPPSREYLGVEVDNILKGCNEITDGLMKGWTGTIGVDEIKRFNKIALDGLSLDKDTIPGEIRKHSVGVATYRGAPPEDCEYLLGRMCKWINGLTIDDDSSEILSGILKAILSHIYIAWIHPFGDGNGRTARLVEFKILLASGVPTPAAHLLSNHYNSTRTEYYRQLDYTSKSGGDLMRFVKYAVQGLVDGLKSQLLEIQKQHLSVGWKLFIYGQFRDKTGITYDRRRRLLLDLTKEDNPVPLDKIRELSPRMAEFYAGKTLRTVRRDINELLLMNLIKHEGHGYSAKKERMLSFFPQRLKTNTD